ncbi:hypothetical protein SAMN02910447_00902 [Ruminococcus sp. YE71]|uniref:hypothetical protein n=1 Tax=unclassified Ruminococcus TaxID=2608920 RepID=UPI00087FADB8|nr:MULTISPECIES: hypothetical protein [unclassified Ruminococcus]SDA15296.1 hypothetical protein SAMN02910446_00901 [Ruminococcus sp. YE78]SFW22311.1 hypothetical protein SAMN02910447_00902 [Ruminococcus sp. YE71]
MKKKLITAAAAAAVMLSMSGCAFDEMLGQLDSALESVSHADSSSETDESTDDRPDERGGDKKKPDTQSSAKHESSSAAQENNSRAEPIGEVDEVRFTANAKAVISSYFGLMSAAQYTDAFRLCTDDFIEKHYPQGLKDGENASPVTVSFYDGSEKFDTDELGRSRIRLTVSISPQGKEDQAFDCCTFVVISGNSFLISETQRADGGEETVGLTQEQVAQYARYVYDCTNIYIDLLQAGVYETGDGSELDRLIPEYTPGGHYMVTIGPEGVESVVYTVDGITAVYPQ